MGLFSKFLKSLFPTPENKYIEQEKTLHKALFDNIDGRSLDDNQRTAVVDDSPRQLVVAGAGSGKTLTISAKVKYLVDVKGIAPEDILLISFTRKAADEMHERIKKLGIDIDSSTFHKYGLGILTEVDKKQPDVVDNISDYLDKYLNTGQFSDEIRKYDNGTAQPNLGARDLAKFLLPLPPLAEQHRIVARIEEMLSCCDQQGN